LVTLSYTRCLAREHKSKGEVGVSYQFQQFILCEQKEYLPCEVLEEVFKRMDFEDIKNCVKVANHHQEYEKASCKSPS